MIFFLLSIVAHATETFNVSCVHKNASVEATYSSNEQGIMPASVSVSLKQKGRMIPLSNLMYSPMYEGNKVIGRMFLFDQGSLVIWDKGDNSYANANGKTNGLISYVINGDYSEFWMACAADSVTSSN